MKYKNRIVAVILTTIMIMTLVGCESKKVSYVPLTDEDSTVYQISICQDSNSDYYQTIALGFQDALTTLFGENHVQITANTATNELTTDTICEGYAKAPTQLIFANGKHSLSSALAATEEIPIISTGVFNFADALAIELPLADTLLPEESDSEEEIETWDYKSNRNVTGVSATPAISQQLSLLIEATPSLTAVALIRGQEDTDALYQNQLMKVLLEEAGIPWKEYEFATILPEQSSASAISHNEDLIETIATECNAIYFPAGSNLTNQAKAICEKATELGISTVGGDSEIGKYSLVCLHSDPYALGYAAGKMVYRVLVNEEDPGTIKINRSSTDATAKLYQSSVASQLSMIFPKSFTEYNEFIETYEIGSTTEKIEIEPEAESEDR